MVLGKHLVHGVTHNEISMHVNHHKRLTLHHVVLVLTYAELDEVLSQMQLKEFIPQLIF